MWQAKRFPDEYGKIQRSFLHPLNLVLIAYNIIWWIPLVLAGFQLISYEAGFVSFLAVTVVRLTANFYRNNVLSGSQATNFPLRIP